MKTNLKKVGVILFIVLQVFLWTAIMSFKSPPPPVNSWQHIMTMDRGTNVYRVSIEGEQYILVTGSSSSMSITKAH